MSLLLPPKKAELLPCFFLVGVHWWILWLATNKNRTCGLLNASKACLLQNNAGRCFFYGKLFPSPLKFASQLFGVPREFLLNGNPEAARYIFAKTKEKGVKIPFFFWSEWQESNLRPLEPHSSALPNCATPRYFGGGRKPSSSLLAYIL